MPQLLSILNNIQQVLNSSQGELNMTLKDSRSAARTWGMKDSALDRVPRAKFLFLLNFLRPMPPDGSVPGTSQTSYGDWASGISFLVKSVSRPNITFKTETVNQYNKKRVIQTGIEYQPINVAFYDTYDQRALKMFKDYTRFYYGEFAAGNRNSWNNDVISPEYQDLGGLDFGFIAPSEIPNDSYFFENIEFYQFGGGRYSKFVLVHPKIASFDYDDEDYTDTTTPQMLNLSFQYEGIIFEEENATIDPSLASTYGLDLGEFNDVFFPGYRRAPAPNSNLIQATNGSSIVRGVTSAIAGVPNVATPPPNSNNPSFTSSIGNGLRTAFYNRNEILGDVPLNRSINSVVGAGQTINNLARFSATANPGRIAGDVFRSSANNLVSRTIGRFTGGLFG